MRVQDLWGERMHLAVAQRPDEKEDLSDQEKREEIPEEELG